MTTIYQKFQETVSQYGEQQFLAELKNAQYFPLTYLQVADRVHRCAAGLISLGCVAGDHLGIMVANGIDWITVDLACAQLGLVIVPIHTTYNFQYLAYTLQHSDSQRLIIDQVLWDKFQDQITQLALKDVIIRGEGQSFSELLTHEPFMEVVQKDELALHTIIYTSGTTAEPKGVMLNHKNVLSNVEYASHYVLIGPDDRFFSFLPLSHILERTGGYYAPMSFGAAIYFATSSLKIAEEIVIARPTLLLAVPRIFEKMHQKIRDTVDAGPAWKRKLFYLALDSQKELQRSFWKVLQRAILKKIVIDKITARLGGRLRFVICGGAALDVHIAKFFETIGIPIMEGYGLTETSPIVAVNPLGNYRFGTVGKVLENTRVILTPDKEILVQGEGLMLGYYSDQVATSAAIDADGWFHTGDRGYIDSDGFLTITGRIKEIIVLSTGKNINPVPIEQALNLNKYITQSLVYGDGQKHLSALIVPDFKELDLWLNTQQIKESGKESLSLGAVKDLFNLEIKESLKEYNNIERVIDFILVAEEFTAENGLLTPSLKMKRMKIISRLII